MAASRRPAADRFRAHRRKLRSRPRSLTRSRPLPCRKGDRPSIEGTGRAPVLAEEGGASSMRGGLSGLAVKAITRKGAVAFKPVDSEQPDIFLLPFDDSLCLDRPRRLRRFSDTSLRKGQSGRYRPSSLYRCEGNPPRCRAGVRPRASASVNCSAVPTVMIPTQRFSGSETLSSIL